MSAPQRLPSGIPQLKILGFSPRVYEAVQKFFADHPVFEMEQAREIGIEGPGGEMVRYTKIRCLKCHFEATPGDNPMLAGQGPIWPADMLRATRWTHAWDQQSRASYCGGRAVWETEAL